MKGTNNTSSLMSAPIVNTSCRSSRSTTSSSSYVLSLVVCLPHYAILVGMYPPINVHQVLACLPLLMVHLEIAIGGLVLLGVYVLNLQHSVDVA